MLMFRLAAATVILSSFALASTACSDDDTTPYGSPSPSPTSSSQGSSATSPTSLNGCTTFADGDTIAWTLASKPPSTCLRVKKGASVTWNGDLGVHPLAPKGGDAANPITAISAGSTKTFTFDTPGTYGFVCASHSSMTGAISVVE
jgi:plastocyanin